MLKTKIEWADSTWNPVTGCLHGCEYCYARRIAERWGTLYKGPQPEDEGLTFLPDEPERFYELDEPVRGEDGKAEPYPANFYPTLHKYRLNQPQKWVKPQDIFVCSMADLFGDWVPDDWIMRVFDACCDAPRHRYLFLTKNPARYAKLARAGMLPQRDNFWYGSTLDSMKSMRYPGRILDHTFVSIEPLTERMDVGLGSFGGDEWIIIGAETGNRKGKVIPEKEWVDTICAAADLTRAAVFMKDSLIPIVGEENMRQELPWMIQAAKGAAQGAGANAAQDVLKPAT